MRYCCACLTCHGDEIDLCAKCKALLRPIPQKWARRITVLKASRVIRILVFSAALISLVLSLFVPIEYTNETRDVPVESFATYTQQTEAGIFVETFVTEVTDVFEITTRRTVGGINMGGGTSEYYLALNDAGEMVVLNKLNAELDELLNNRLSADSDNAHNAAPSVKVKGRTVELPEITSSLPSLDSGKYVESLLDGSLDEDKLQEAFTEEWASNREFRLRISQIGSYIDVGRVYESVTDRVYVSGNLFLRNLALFASPCLLIVGIIMFFFERKLRASIVDGDSKQQKER